MMSPSRFQQIWGGMNGAARKVYEEVPHTVPDDASQIAIALGRARTPMSLKVIQGCLEQLRAAGLVKQGKDGYIRVGVRKPAKKTLADLKEVLQETTEPAAELAAPYTPPPAPKPETPPMTTKPHPENLSDKIGTLAQQLQAMALRQQQAMHDLAASQKEEMCALADLIADAALDVQEKFDKDEESMAKVRQLQALLKGI